MDTEKKNHPPFVDATPSISRREVLAGGASAMATSAAALMGASQAAQAQGRHATTVQAGSVGGRKFKAWVTRGTGPNNGSVEELTLRPISGRQVVVRTEATQLCYSLAAAVLGDPGNPSPMFMPHQPTIMGHGGVGIVEAVGPQVKRVQVGDRVIVGVTPQCGQCFNCLHGRADTCNFVIEPQDPIADTADGIPIAINTVLGPGGYAELMVPYEEWCVPVFTDASPVELSMLSCVGSTGLGSTTVLGRVRPGSNVLVFGAGPIGLSAIEGARLCGAGQIIAVEPLSARREISLKLGATTALDPNIGDDNLLARIRDLCKPRTKRGFAGGLAGGGFGAGADFVVVAVGASWRPNPAIADPTGVTPAKQAFELSSAAGTLTTLGVLTVKTVEIPGLRWEIFGPTHYPVNLGGTHIMRDIPAYVRLIERGLYDANSLATSIYPLHRMREAYQAVIDRSTVTSVVTFT